MTEHGTIECYDAGCRRPVCVHAQRKRIEAARSARLAAVVSALIPSSEPPSDPPEEDPGDEDPPTV